jgi:hypothetical protein
VLVLVLLIVVYAAWPGGGPGATGAAPVAGSGPSPAPGAPDDPTLSPPDAPPPTTGTARPSHSASAARQVPVADQIAALQTLVSQQADAGHLDARTADELHSTLDDIGRRASRGQTGAAAARAMQLRSRLTELNQLGKLTTAGYQVLAPAVDQFVSSLGHG